MDEVVQTDLTLSDGVPTPRADPALGREEVDQEVEIKVLGVRVRMRQRAPALSPSSRASAVVALGLVGCAGAGLLCFAGYSLHAPATLVIIGAVITFLSLIHQGLRRIFPTAAPSPPSDEPGSGRRKPLEPAAVREPLRRIRRRTRRRR
jgi:hypothetical protein